MLHRRRVGTRLDLASLCPLRRAPTHFPFTPVVSKRTSRPLPSHQQVSVGEARHNVSNAARALNGDTRKASRVDTRRLNLEGLIVNDTSDLSSHRTRTNRRPEPAPLHPPAALIVAVDDIFTDTIQDKD